MFGFKAIAPIRRDRLPFLASASFMFVLAHLSDPHLAPLSPPDPLALASKRLIGFLNWRWRRAAIHWRQVLDAITSDLKHQSPDHLVITGDLVNIALPAEFAAARRWLESLGEPANVTVVPGNHDAYVRSASGEWQRCWADYMRGDDAPGFPFVRRRGPVALIGLSTAVPTPLFMATGALGAQQIARLADLLRALADEPLFRIVLIHHPPRRKIPVAHKRLIDAEAFCDVIAREGAELIIHGHHHDSTVEWLDGPKGRVAAVGVPSASASSDGHHEPAAYNCYRIDGSPHRWRCETVSRGLTRGGQAIGELRRQVLFG